MGGGRRGEKGGKPPSNPSGGEKKEQSSTTTASEMPAVISERQTLTREVGNPQPFVGLKNLGATCYMNSVLQTLVTTPELREFLLNWKLDPKQQHSKNVAYQLQLLFARMQRADIFAHVDPNPLMKSFGMGADAHRQQHDCQELIRVLFGVVADCTQLAKTDDIIAKHYAGKFEDYRECLNCGEKTSTETPFHDITVALSAMEIFSAQPEEGDEAAAGAAEFEKTAGYNLLESLLAYSAPDIIEGAHCEACDQRKGLKKGEQLSELPDILSLQLRRFGYDMTTGKREKNYDNFELPRTVDLSSVLPQATQEKAKAEGKAYNYTVHSLICHRGTAYHGHYYSFVQTEPGRWIKFDDDTVTEADPLEVEEYLNPTAWQELKKERDEQEEKEKAEKREKAKQERDAERALRIEVEAAAPTAGGAQESESNTPAAPTTQDVGLDKLDSGDAMDTAALFGPTEGVESDGIIDTTALFAIDPAAVPGNKKASFKPKPSGQSYYVVYRRCGSQDLPKLTPVPPEQLQASLTAALEKEVVEMETKRKRLAEIANVCVAAVHHPLAGDNTTYWVECSSFDTSVEDVASKFAEQHPQMAQTFPVGSHGQTWRLRRHTGNLLGDSCEPGLTLKDLGFKFESLGFPHFGVEFGSPPWRMCKSSDLVLDLTQWTPPNENDAGDEGDTPFAGVEVDNDADAPAAVGKPKTFKKVPTRFTVYADCTVRELYEKLATLLGVSSVAQVGVTLNRNGNPVNPFEPKVAVISSGTFEKPKTVMRTHDYAPDEDSWEKPIAEFGITQIESLFIEPVAAEDPGALLKAPDFITKSNFVDVRYTIQTDDYSSASDCEGGEPKEEVATLDGRQHFDTLKQFLCDKANENMKAGGNQMTPKNCQLLHGGSVQELRDLKTVKIKTMAMGTGCLSVKLVEGPPLKRDEFYCEVFESVEGNYLEPVKFLKRFVANAKTGPGEILTLYREIMHARKADDDEQGSKVSAVLMKLPSHNFRIRMMEPKKRKSLGYPVLKASIRQCWREGHGADEIRVVVQILSRDPTYVPADGLTKDHLILHTARWNSEQEDVKQALTDKKEYTPNKFTSALLTKNKLVSLSGIPLEFLQVARAKYYQTQGGHDGAWRLNWDQFDAPKNQEKDIGSHPFRFEHEEFVLYRDKREEWKYVSADAKAKGGKKKEASAGKKAAVKEVGISIHSVWEGADDEDEEEQQGEGVDKEDGSAPPPQKQAAHPESTTGVTTLNQDPYMELLHGTLESSCDICFDDFVEGANVTVLNCHHIYHHDCLVRWVEQSATCPSCKEPVN